MQKIILGLVLALLLPVSGINAQNYDKPPTLSVQLTSDSPFVYRDADGFLVVVGEVINNEKSPVSNVRIKVNFYEQSSSQPTEVVRGGTILNVVPPLGKSPYVIKSSNADPNLTQVSVSMEGFDSSPSKEIGLQVIPGNVIVDSSFRFSGIIKNIGGADSGEANVYVAFYDVFDPPRLVGISSYTIKNIPDNGEESFNFNEPPNSRAATFSVFSESQIFQSNMIKMDVPPQELITRLVTISSVSITSEDGSNMPQASVGKPVNIQGETWIQYSADQSSQEHPFVLYAQVKQSGEKPYVEYIGYVEGKFIGAEKQFPKIQWTPAHSGVYYIETFLWDDKGVPMAEPGPILLVVVS